MKSKFYKVTCKCGHVGQSHFIRIVFPINASSGKEASQIARNIGRVKHEHKFAIINCEEIDQEEYRILIVINKNDPYLNCENRQEQRRIAGLSLRIENEPEAVVWKKDRKASVEYKLKKEKIALEEERNILRGDWYGVFAC